MTKDTMNAQLWKPRSVAETLALYHDWAATYDSEVLASGYVTPIRIVQALTGLAPPQAPILDFGCGTGLAGQALRDGGFRRIDGTDITQAMLDIAAAKNVYEKTWLSQPGALSFGRGLYDVIVAAGVISLGAAPPDTLAALVAKLATSGLLAFSYNDPTLGDASYTGALADIIGEGLAEVVFRAHGPHLPEKGMGSDVIILRRR
jgi:predicted TPR repeat methyltransferase